MRKKRADGKAQTYLKDTKRKKEKLMQEGDGNSLQRGREIIQGTALSQKSTRESIGKQE